MKKVYLQYFLFFMVLMGCSKDAVESTAEVDHDKPVVKIMSPSTNENYERGGQLCFKALVEDKSMLKLVSVKINDNGNSCLKSYEYFPESRVFVIDQKYSIPMDKSGRVTLQFVAVDSKGNMERVELPLSVSN